ncbi:hypothetical protein CEQ90_14150 [Lewinellaceae bacterium SD302]|nr:hypothetical protein CEQ90_14150 [Lewinellaceae bacterium SD302]
MPSCKNLLLLLLIGYSLLTACGGKDASEDANTPASYSDMIEAATEQYGEIQKKNERAVHEPAILKAMLPETVLGMRRQKIASNASGMAGFQIATANARYQSDNSRKSITITISDGMGGNLTAMGMVNSFTVDSEEGTRSTKTIKIGGKKAVRTFDTANGKGSLSVIYDQSIVQIEGSYLESVDELKKAFDTLSLSEL